MRPVVKVNPTTFAPNYPYFTAVSLGTPLAFGAPSSIATAFNGGAAGALPMLTFLTALLNHRTGVYAFPLVGMTAGAQAYCVGRIRALLAPIYRTANPHLTVQIGGYCAYCEIAMPGNHLDVEHRVPKGNFPLGTTLWWNFLTACGRCDSAKGPNPTRPVAIGWAGGGAPGEPAIMQAVEDQHFWADLPDVHSNQRLSFRRMRYRLRDVAGTAGNGAYWLITPAYTIAANTSFASFVNYDVRANIPLAPAALPTPAVHVEVTADGTPAVLPAWAAAFNVQTVATLAFVGLSVLGSARAGYRTLTWFRVLAALNNIEALMALILLLAPPQAIIDLAFELGWAQFLLAAQAFGHYSTMVRLLLQIPYPINVTNLVGYPSLGDRFIADSSPAAGLPLVMYPGTFVATVP